ncbi:MAG: C4-dicarboxylate transporter DcuC [Armatimonadota bacterium]
MGFQIGVGLVIIAAAVFAVLRRVDVRLALLLAALALGTLAGDPAAIVQKFFATFTSPDYVIPLGCAMGFAYVLRHTECDQHLVHLLTDPLRKARIFLIPGAVLVGFIVNIPIISQTSSAVAIGSVLIPLLLAAKVSRVTAGAALLLGVSIGGELFNQGAPEYRSVIAGTAAVGLPRPTEAALIQQMLPLNLLNLAVATSVFWFLSLRAEKKHAAEREFAERREEADPARALFKVSLFKAAVPLIPLALLFILGEPLRLLSIPHEWLVGSKEAPALLQKAADFLEQPSARGAIGAAFSARLIGAAMLIGAIVAALTDFKKAGGVAGAFFEGAGYALAHVVSIIVAAACFGEGVRLIGLDKPIGHLIDYVPGLLQPAAGFLTLAFGAVSGSGIAATQSLFGFFAAPALQVGVAPEHVGAIVSIGAAAGRTMSPVAAVTLMSASLTETDPLELVKRVAPPLLIGVTTVVIAGMLMVAFGHRRLPDNVPTDPPVKVGRVVNDGARTAPLSP